MVQGIQPNPAESEAQANIYSLPERGEMFSFFSRRNYLNPRKQDSASNVNFQN